MPMLRGNGPMLRGEPARAPSEPGKADFHASALRKLAGILGEAWESRAECVKRALDPELFFPAYGKKVPSEVISACSVCEVRRECFDRAMRLERFEGMGRHGVWAGFTGRQRTRLANGRTVIFASANTRARSKRRTP